MSTEGLYHFTRLLRVLKKSLRSLILYYFFHDLIHVYSPGQGAYSPQGTKFWCQNKRLVTSVICCYFQIIDDNSFWKINCFTFFPYKSIRGQIWPCNKIGQGQPRVIIWTNLVVIKHLMLHIKFQGHWPFGSGEDGFYHIWACRPSWSCDQDHLNKLSFPHPMETPYEIWLQLAQWFLRRCLKVWMIDRQMTEASSQMSLRLRWANNHTMTNKKLIYHTRNIKWKDLCKTSTFQSIY